ncbi:MAG: phosphoenolpyruvate--protein phosphotransferase [Ostreibacterium sp.]
MKLPDKPIISQASLVNKMEQTPQAFAYRQTLILPNPQGMHARPAAKLVKLVKSFDATIFLEIADGRCADTKKMFEVLGLGIVQGDEISVLSDSQQAMEKVVKAIESGLGDNLKATDDSQNKPNEIYWQPQGDIRMMQAVGASDGLVIGKIHCYGQQHFSIPEASEDPSSESKSLDNALQTARRAIHTLMDEVSNNDNGEQAAIFDAHLSILEDKDIINDTLSRILTGENAAKAYKIITDERIASLSAVANSNIAARAIDIRDVRNRVLNTLLGIQENPLQFDKPVILCADDLTPSDTARINPAQVLGFITAKGGPTSHSAIIARGMGIPAIVAAGEAVRTIDDGTTVILDGASGRIYIDPNGAQLADAKIAQDIAEQEREKALKNRLIPGQTADGKLIEISANINRADAAESAIDAGAQGVGLMRTEFLYLESNSIPSEDEQESEYRAMAEAMGDKPLIIRTLDIGGDKEVPYLNLAHEDNAFLGIRGIRLCFERPDLFIPQLRAICRVAKNHHNIHVMFPMIGKLADWTRAKEMLDNVRKEMGTPEFPVGIMIEIPSAALLAPQLAKEVDFFSVGTNDLTQYTLAMDRMHPILASQTDALHPAVLRLIDMTIRAADANGKWVGVCGGAAGEVAAAKILVGLGVRELSMSTPQIAPIKQMLRENTSQDLQTLAQQALAQESAKAVRQLIANQKDSSSENT